MKNILKKIPAGFWAYFIFVLSNLVWFNIARAGLYLFFKADTAPASSVLLKSFYIGFKFDLRLSLLIALPLGIILMLPLKKWLKNLTAAFYALAGAALSCLYITDFAYYAYLKERLNAYILDLAANNITSAEMVWQTYPVIKLFIVILIFGAAYFFWTKYLLNYAAKKADGKKHWAFCILALLLTGAGVQGQVSQYPLRWSNAYFSSDVFASALALNPAQNLYDTYKFAAKADGYNEDKTREHYDIVADYLGVKNKDAQNLNFERRFPEAKGGAKDYNIVVILMESLAYDKTSFNAPELDATPFLAELAPKSMLFKRFFTPAAGTAKGLFASFTALPDTSSVKTSSRNPLIVKQHLLPDDLEGYEKFYFIGGSANWGNVRGMLQYNIKDLKIFEEGVYKDVARNDVWGLSDLDMFKYAAKELGQSKQPFYAFLHTSGFHRPYTIPDDNDGFKTKELDEDMLKEYGFSGNAEYNSLRFEDFALGRFFELAAKEPFFKNTIFFIYGDHGLTVAQSKNTPKAIINLSLTTNNTPLIVFGPGVKPGVDNKPLSQVDVTATIMGVLGRPYRATALGRDVFNKDTQRGAFILNSSGTPLNVGYLEDGYYYTNWSNKKGLFKYESDNSDKDYCQEKPELCQRMAALADGLYETSRYMTYHNK